MSKMSFHKNDIKISAKAVVCEESKLRGDITIGAGTVVHPKATILAEAGPIVIGEGCLIEEQSKIIHRLAIDEAPSDATPVLFIGSNNVFEVGSVCEARSVGDNNILECKAYVGPRVTLPNGCTIGAACRLTRDETLADHTVIFGDLCQQRESISKPTAQTLQLDYLSKVLPNYHHLRRPNRKN